MVLPAFFQLAQQGLLPEEWYLVGNGRGDVSHEDFTARVHDALTEFGPHPDEGPWADFSKRLRFAGGGFASDDPGSLLDVLSELENDELEGEAQYVHYLAVPPGAFAGLVSGLAEHGLAEGSRVVFEKPYGTSPESFRELDELVLSVLGEDQVFRIDHFLGKEGTQDLHVLRFANGLFEHVWDAEHVSQVQIDVPETLDVSQRADFYDATGATLDMLVTHLFQVAAEVAMEPPASLDPADLQTAREAVLAAFRPLAPEDVVLGQFQGYTDIDGVDDDSRTDTFVAARLWVDSDRWRGVPFLLRTGKKMAVSEQRVSLVLRKPDGPVAAVPGHGNVVSLSLSGAGSLSLQLIAKLPGPDLSLAPATTTLDLKDIAGGNPLPPYVSLIHDVITGDRSLFTTSEGLAHTWRVAQPLLDSPPAVQPYPGGSWGPVAADELPGPCSWVVGRNRD
ncbi:glucose-6-phosphate dehydrogenase [Modestobacter sp. I12A-02628]|uniref:Glucose-6-phosphate 1-dehydrogenase n=2 Tax=Goekera deserti TaxID=2497753 RepID=A0A7K3WJ39_9ACTN|nr:glucose-6-phosphate dehydrogenase [Goekera deserti]NDI50284.1 glucose-6-phosphate dehydrogenase [Goekera deserti]NEL56464.1 glucose-6-phosphate dehydrogenase (NADP(+)) [Goekera deserti]